MNLPNCFIILANFGHGNTSYFITVQQCVSTSKSYLNFNYPNLNAVHIKKLVVSQTKKNQLPTCYPVSYQIEKILYLDVYIKTRI